MSPKESRLTVDDGVEDGDDYDDDGDIPDICHFFYTSKIFGE